MLHLIPFFLFFIIASTAQAKDGDEDNFFKTFIEENKEFSNLLELRSERVFRLTYPDCVSNVQLLRVEPSILLPPVKRPTPKVEIEEDDKDDAKPKVEIVGNTQIKEEPKETEDDKTAPSPIYGQWIERVHAKGCNKTVLINHITIGYKNKTPVIMPLINGLTRLDPIDQPFAEKAIIERLKKLEKPCETAPFTMDSSIVGYRTKDGGAIQKEDAGYGWFERWTIRACGAQYSAKVAILPDPKTRYRYIARLKKI